MNRPIRLMQPKASGAVYAFAIELGAAARIFTMEQIARHPELSWRTRPRQRACEMLAPYRDSFDVLPGTFRGPFIWRLSEKEKRRRGLSYKSISATSQKTAHWIALGDVWMALVFAGMRPERWNTEKRDMGGFDIFAVVRGTPILFEVQRTPLTEREWKRRWNERIEWYQKRLWTDERWAQKYADRAPKVALVTTFAQDAEKMHLPRGTVLARSIEDLPCAIRRATENAI